MKYCFSLLLSALFFSPLALAASNDRNPQAGASTLGELTFFPETGTFLNKTDLTAIYSKASVDTPIEYSDFTNRSFELYDRLDYSFQKNHSLFLRLAYAEFYTKEDLSTGTSKHAASRGFTNPEVGYKVRLLEQQKETPFNVDLQAAFAPSLLDKKAARPAGADGTVASGKNIFSVSAHFTGKQDKFEWDLSPHIIYNGEEKSDDTDNLQAKVDSYFNGSLSAKGQYSLKKDLLLDFGVGYGYTPTRNINTTVLGASVNAESGAFSAYSANVGLTKIVIPNKVTGFISLEAAQTTDFNVNAHGQKFATLKNDYAIAPRVGMNVIL
jgi:hypothetical protein